MDIIPQFPAAGGEDEMTLGIILSVVMLLGFACFFVMIIAFIISLFTNRNDKSSNPEKE